MVQASSIVSKVRLQLIDTGLTPRWTDAELLGYISDGQRTMVTISPSLTATRIAHPLLQGSRQRIPTDGYMLLDIPRNMGVDGVTPGRAVRIIKRDLLDALKPSWHGAATTPTAQNFLYDPLDPVTFHVYPPSDGQGKVELLYSRMPAEVTSLTDEITTPETFQTGLFYYVMFRACAKDSDFAAGQSLAQSWFTLFNNFMGVGRTSDLTESPNQGLAPADPNTRGAAK